MITSLMIGWYMYYPRGRTLPPQIEYKNTDLSTKKRVLPSDDKSNLQCDGVTFITSDRRRVGIRDEQKKERGEG